jgi:uncharacterized protein YgiM (DUF1202 family)
MLTRTLLKGVSVVVTASVIALGGAVVINPEAGPLHAAAQETAVPAFTAGQIVQIEADALNMRADASIDAEIVTTLLNGTWATVVDGPVVGDEYTWYQVEYDDFTGWVADEFLIDAASAPPLAIDTTVIVNTSALNLRSAAGSSSEVVEILEASTEGQVIGGPETVDDMVWYQVDFSGTQGWVSRSYLALPPVEDAAITEETEATPAVVVTDDAI